MTKDEFNKRMDEIFEPIDNAIVLLSVRGYEYKGGNAVEQLKQLFSEAMDGVLGTDPYPKNREQNKNYLRTDANKAKSEQLLEQHKRKEELLK